MYRAIKHPLCLHEDNSAFICITMNWRTIIGIILLIIGIRGLYMALTGTDAVPSSNKVAIAVWLFAGAYFTLRGYAISKYKQ